MQRVKRLLPFMLIKYPNRRFNQNEGAVPDLPADCVVEVTALADKGLEMLPLVSYRQLKKVGYR